ncbi:MAG: NAD(P)/FAD-dependent oxidoreductase [Candidatus Rokubacteria bacterium]|nr:NAD(P)/FAD-dependent oxidoreductase [Candidatus Rokubacteria bacterium]
MKVVIIGAGFAGLQCAQRLSGTPVDVLLIDRNNYHLFTPLLYQVASSLLNPSDIAYPVRAVFRGSPNVRFLVVQVTGVALDAKIVRTADGGRLPYDYLVIATGSATNFFGLGSVERAAHGLKDLPEAVALRTHVIRAFERAARETDQAALRACLTFVVVGGGPTGVEYAGALSELIHRVLIRDYAELDLRAVRVILVEALDRVLPAFLPALSSDARTRLERLGVEVRLGARLLDATDGRITLSSGEIVAARTLVWAAGVKPSELDTALGVRRTPSRRIAVDEYLRIPDYPGAFAIGDVAGAIQDGSELAMMSPQAMQEGRYVADAIVRLERKQPLQPFRYRDRGIMATIGRHAAVAQVGPLSFTGPFGWFVWLFVHLYYIIGYRNRLVVLISWAWNYVFYDRPIRLMTRGKDGTEGE